MPIAIASTTHTDSLRTIATGDFPVIDEPAIIRIDVADSGIGTPRKRRGRGRATVSDDWQFASAFAAVFHHRAAAFHLHAWFPDDGFGTAVTHWFRLASLMVRTGFSTTTANFFSFVVSALHSRHTFARFPDDCRLGVLKRRRRGALPMNGSLFAELDRFCGQFALALHNTELQIYTVLTLLLVLGVLLFPPRNDPDQA